MAKKPSAETILRRTKQELKDAKMLWQRCIVDRDRYQMRAEKAEKELLEWKRRFDKLLERTPNTASDVKP